MKTSFKVINALIAILYLFAIAACSSKGGTEKKIVISGAWALYPMVVMWAEEYRKLNPEIRIDISAGGAGKGMADTLSGFVDIGMVSRDLKKEEIGKGALGFAVVKDAVVPVINEKNPYLQQLLKTGFKRETFITLWMKGSARTWKAVLGAALQQDAAIHVYTRSDACGAAETWAAYLKGKQENLQGTGIYGDPGIAEAVRTDNLGIGYNNLNFAYDGKSLKPVKGLAILPIDINGNGSIDAAERIYEDRNMLAEAIAKGVYPSPPARNLFMVVKETAKKKEVRDFLQWVMTDGQKFVKDAGYINLDSKQLAGELKKL